MLKKTRSKAIVVSFMNGDMRDFLLRIKERKVGIIMAICNYLVFRHCCCLFDAPSLSHSSVEGAMVVLDG
jgi:hypothetical protein